MGKNGQHTDTYQSRLVWNRLQASAQWRTVAPSRDVAEALADFRDLCFRPPADPAEPNMGTLVV
jgi:hypothetical protein